MSSTYFCEGCTAEARDGSIVKNGLPPGSDHQHKWVVKVEGMGKTTKGHHKFPRAIKVNLSVPLAALPEAGFAGGCKNPIGVIESVEAIQQHLEATIHTESTELNRKAPVLLCRCSRGGKTTVLRTLYNRLRADGTKVIMVSFNGSSNYQKLTGESDSDSLYRVIVQQLDPSLPADTLPKVDWASLDLFIGRDPFVLLIDEVNRVDISRTAIGSDLARVLKAYFLDRSGRHLVLTSHVPVYVDTTTQASKGVWSDSTLSASSNRLVKVANLPFSKDINVLRSIGTEFNGLTDAHVAYFGGIPSLIYVDIAQRGAEDAGMKMSAAGAGVLPETLFTPFIKAIMTGVESPDLGSLKSLCCDVKGGRLGMVYRWPISYIHAVMRRCTSPLAVLVTGELNSLRHECNLQASGHAWEQIIRVAILFHCHLATVSDWPAPMGVVEYSVKGALVLRRSLPQHCTSVDEAHADITQNLVPALVSREHVCHALVLIVPSHATMQQYDGFLAYIRDGQLQAVSGFQCKDSDEAAKGTVQSWLDGRELFRANAPSRLNKATTLSAIKRGWKYDSALKTEGFLGPSLSVLTRRWTAAEVIQ